jgi:hypothetical protein
VPANGQRFVNPPRHLIRSIGALAMECSLVSSVPPSPSTGISGGLLDCEEAGLPPRTFSYVQAAVSR